MYGYSAQNCNTYTCFGIDSKSTSTVCSGYGNCTGVDTCVCKQSFLGTKCERYRTNGYNVDFNISTATSYTDVLSKCKLKDAYPLIIRTAKENSEILSFLVTKLQGLSQAFVILGVSYNTSSTKWLYANGLDITYTNWNIGEPNKMTTEFCVQMYYKTVGTNIAGKWNNVVCSSAGFTICMVPEKCNGIEFNDPRVCSRHGECIDKYSTNFTCVCRENYYGIDCEHHICYGKNYTDKNVCSGHGTCVDANQCICK
jgi:hypothetical protein